VVNECEISRDRQIGRVLFVRLKIVQVEFDVGFHTEICRRAQKDVRLSKSRSVPKCGEMESDDFYTFVSANDGEDLEGVSGPSSYSIV